MNLCTLGYEGLDVPAFIACLKRAAVRAALEDRPALSCLVRRVCRRGYDFVIPAPESTAMGAAVKKTISLPAELAKEAEALARAEGKTLSGVIQEALRQARIGRRQQELRGVQGFWSRKARERGLLTEQDLERYLRS
jgi:predicted transcriptional regulator